MNGNKPGNPFNRSMGDDKQPPIQPNPFAKKVVEGAAFWPGRAEKESKPLQDEERSYLRKELRKVPGKDQFKVKNITFAETQTRIDTANEGTDQEVTKTESLYKGYDEQGNLFDYLTIETHVYPRLQRTFFVYQNKAYNTKDEAKMAAVSDIACECPSPRGPELFSKDEQKKRHQESMRSHPQAEKKPDQVDLVQSRKIEGTPTPNTYLSAQGPGIVMNGLWYLSGIVGANAGLELLGRKNYLLGTAVGLIWGYAARRFTRDQVSQYPMISRSLSGGYHILNLGAAFASGRRLLPNE